MLRLISSHSMLLPWGRGCSSRVSQGQDKPPFYAWNHNSPTRAQTAGKLLIINKHRCAIIMGCLLRYQDRLSSSISQLRNIADGLRRTQSHCGYSTEGPGIIVKPGCSVGLGQQATRVYPLQNLCRRGTQPRGASVPTPK